MVAKVLDLHEPWSCKYDQKRKRKMVAHTFLPSFDNANGRLFQERLFEIRKFCYHDNVTSHFSSLLESKIAIKNGSVLFKFILRIYLNYKCVSLAFDGQDGNGVQLKKNWANFFKVKLLCCFKMNKNRSCIFSLVREKNCY